MSEQMLATLVQRLSATSVQARDEIVSLTKGAIPHLSRSIRGQSCVDPDLAIIARLGSKRVDNDGTFATATAPIHMVILEIERAATPTESGHNQQAGVTYLEATAWRTTLLPNVDEWYLLDAAEPAELTAQRWRVVAFVDSDRQQQLAPADFDWIAHRLRHPGLSVTLLDRDGNRIETVYKNEHIPTFYEPHSEGRGRYWELTIGTPRAADIVTTFAYLAKSVARRGAISDAIRPLSVRWKQGTDVELTLRDELSKRCYAVELDVPTDAQLGSGTHLLRGAPGSLGAIVTSPEQYAAGTVSRLREMGPSGIALWASETECP